MRAGKLVLVGLWVMMAMACRPRPVVNNAPPPTPPQQPPVNTTPDPDLIEANSDAPVLTRVEVGEKTIELKDGLSILFATGSEAILDESLPILDEVALVLKLNPDMRIRVEGHTDNVGGAEFNLDLSKRRAAAVKDYLVSAGVEPQRVENLGCGADYPLVPNNSEENRQINRRVEFVIMKGVVNPCRVYKNTRLPQK